MLNFLPTWLMLRNSQRDLLDSDEASSVPPRKGEFIFLNILMGILIAMMIALVITTIVVYF